jgi:hypothetical protein
MKILQKLVLSLLIISSLFINTTARTADYTTYTDTTIADQSSPVDYKAYLEYTSIGLENPIFPDAVCVDDKCVTESITISGLTKYFQNYQSWSANIMQTCGYTIGNSGCALASLAMIANKYTTDRNPGQLNTFLGNLACPMAWSSAASSLGLSYTKLLQANIPGVSMATAKSTMLGVLRSGKPILLGMGYGTSGTHYVVVRGYTAFDDGSYYFSIYDPSAQKDYSTLDQYMNLWYGIIQVHVYS